MAMKMSNPTATCPVTVYMRPGLEERSAQRRRRIVSHRAANYTEAEQWDLRFWQSQTAEQRLAALGAIREDVRKVKQARESLP